MRESIDFFMTLSLLQSAQNKENEYENDGK